MKIVYCLYDHLSRGGTERIISIKCNELAERGHDVSIIDTSRSNHSEPFFFSPKITFYNLSIPYQENRERNALAKIMIYPILIAKHYRRLKNLISELKPDIVISTNGYEAKLIPMMRLDCKIVLEAHHNKDYKAVELNNRSISIFQRSFLKYWHQLESSVHKYYDAFVVLTEGDRRAYNVPINSIVIPNPLTLTSADTAPLVSPCAISLGRLSYQKGFDLLIDVWTEVQKQLPEWELDIYGEGEEHPMLANKIEKQGLVGKVHIHPFTKEVAHELISHSIYILSSRHEGFGLVLLEAMECGVPCVVFNCKSGPDEIVTDQEDGIVVANGDIIGMANAIVALAKDEERRRAMGLLAKKNVQRYSKSNILDKWEELFHRITNQ